MGDADQPEHPLPRIGRRVQRPQHRAPMEGNRPGECDPNDAVKRCGRGEADTLDQAARSHQANRQSVDRQHAHAHDTAAKCPGAATGTMEVRPIWQMQMANA